MCAHASCVFLKYIVRVRPVSRTQMFQAAYTSWWAVFALRSICMSCKQRARKRKTVNEMRFSRERLTASRNNYNKNVSFKANH